MHWIRVALVLMVSLPLGLSQLGAVLPPGSLPPVPAGLPSYFSFGLTNGNTAVLPAGMPLDFRYQYLAGGVNTGSGWATWNANGSYAANYINDSRARSLIPTFTYYQILQSGPTYDEFSNLQNSSTMYAYYGDFKLLMQKAGQAGGTVLVQIEPDLEGAMQQHSTNAADDASRQPASVSSSGHPDVQGIPNTFRGYFQALVHLRDLYAPNVLLGLSVSPWGATNDISLIRDPTYNWQNHATRTAKYLNSFGPGFQLLFYGPSDRDSAWYQIVQNQNRWWDETNASLPNFNRMAEWMGMIIAQTNKRAMMWQVPIGNRVYRTENNADGHWQDNRAEYFLNPSTGRAHIAQWANYGFLGMMFGSGVGSQTHYYDYKSDGTTNPAAINGNSAVSAYTDDDGGYLRLRIAAYYGGGRLPLPGSGTPPSPTPSPALTATSTPTSIPSRTATLSNTATATPVLTATPTSSRTPTHTQTRTATPNNTPTVAPTLAATRTPTGTPFNTPSATVIGTVTSTPTPVSYAVRSVAAAPNPFNPARGASTISFELSGACPTTVAAIIQLETGSFVRLWNMGSQGAGLHSVQWDGRSAIGVSMGEGFYAGVVACLDQAGRTLAVGYDLVDVSPVITNMTIAPWPFDASGRNATLQYTLGLASAYTQVVIQRTQGAVVREFPIRHSSAGVVSEMWDGRDSSGNLVPDGPYVFGVVVQNKSNTSDVHVGLVWFDYADINLTPAAWPQAYGPVVGP